jgi:hypothetical protein
MFVGPFASGLVAARAPWLLPGVLALALATLAVALAVRGTPRSTPV